MKRKSDVEVLYDVVKKANIAKKVIESIKGFRADIVGNKMLNSFAHMPLPGASAAAAKGSKAMAANTVGKQLAKDVAQHAAKTKGSAQAAASATKTQKAIEVAKKYKRELAIAGAAGGLGLGAGAILD